MGSDLYLEEMHKWGTHGDSGAYGRGWRAGIDTVINNYLRMAGKDADPAILERFEEMRRNPPSDGSAPKVAECDHGVPLTQECSRAGCSGKPWTPRKFA